MAMAPVRRGPTGISLNLTLSENLRHAEWDCKYYVVTILKDRRKSM
jgi:hypothetical protein